MIQAIFFDFNGVIIDDERLQMTAYQDVLRHHGMELTEEQYFSALGMDDRTFVRTALTRAEKFTEETMNAVLAEKTAIHRKLIEAELPFFPGVITFIKAAAREFSLGLVSMASQSEIGYVIDRALLRRYFSVIITADEVHLCKPSPDCFQHALEKLNEMRRTNRLLPLLPTECLVIEDSPPGVISGRTAGMHTLAVTNTVPEAQLRAVGAEVVTASLADWTTDAVRLLFR
jgi:HAD superfamily hydrolase (TIGR01509 family)